MEEPPNPDRGGEPGRRRRRRRSRPQTERRGEEAVGRWLLLLTLFGSALLFGAVQVPVFLGVAVVGFAAAFLVARALPVPGGGVPLPAKVLLALSLFTVIQALPLPMGLLTALAPKSAAVWAGSLVPFGEGPPRWASISLDPGASWVEATKFALYAVVFVACAAIGGRRGASFGAVAVFASSAVVAAVTMAHGLFGMQRVYGLYAPSFGIARWHVGPLLNSNNLAGYLNLGGLCGIGLVAQRTEAPKRWLMGMASAMVLGSAVVAGSRGGLVGLAVGIVVGVVALRVVNRSDRSSDVGRSQVASRAVALVLLGAGVLALLGTSTDVARELSGRDVDKLKLALYALPMVKDHALFGIGRGAFESVFPAYRVGINDVVFTHPENFLVQWTVEWGVPVGAGALAVLAWSLRPSALGVARGPASAGVFAAVTALLVQNLVDLGLEVPAVSLAAAVCLGSCWGASRAFGPTAAVEVAEAPRRLSWGRSLGVLGFGALLCGLSLVLGTQPVGRDRTSVREQLLASDLSSETDREGLRTALHAAMVRHPAEAYFPRLGAIVAWAGNSSPMPWIHRALERALESGRTHYLLARLLASGGQREQATMELRYAVEYDDRLDAASAKAALLIVTNETELMRTVPPGMRGAGMLVALARGLSERGDLAMSERLYGDAVSRDPARLDALLGHARALLTMLSRPDLFDGCRGERRHECALAVKREADAVGVAQPKTSAADELRARLAMTLGDPRTAERLLADRCQNFDQQQTCLHLRVEAAAASGDRDLLLEAARAIRATCHGPVQCVQTTSWIGDIFLASATPASALSYYEEAAQTDPTPNRWRRVADLASRLGEHSKALYALQRAGRSGEHDDDLKGRLEQERQEALRSTLLGR